MKYLRRYNESNEEQDLDFVLVKIKEEFPIDKVKETYDKEVDEWSGGDFDLPPEEQGEDFDGSSATWYAENGNGEAQDVILNQMIGWFELKHSSLSDELFEEVYNKLQEEYEFLNID